MIRSIVQKSRVASIGIINVIPLADQPEGALVTTSLFGWRVTIRRILVVIAMDALDDVSVVVGSRRIV